MRDNAIGGTKSAGSGRPVTRDSRTAAAVVDVACADGKLSLLGVPTLTTMLGWCGRSLRTTRLMMTAAACAANAPTPTASHA